MPVQHLHPARKTRSQARAQAVLTPTPRAPLDGTSAVPQLRAHLDRGPIVEGEEPFTKEGRGPRRSSSPPGVVGSFQAFQRSCLIRLSHQSEPSLLEIMQQMTQIMANIQAASSSEASRPPSSKNLSIKAPSCFYGTQTSKFRSFIQSYQLIFHNDQANFPEYRKKVLYYTSSLTGRDSKWIEPYLFPSALKTQATSSIIGPYLNLNS
ncbi:hypothetical protein O181_001563 [Austropuccinia psidii MF-1]|uniref:DUF4939 domain-containing protein n=1 Tax=Austropuccinia psidii MF-1 TaxID=1389203 RepID=A0A9Q3BB10_9BASI|nr:hypothetical protein [Austropuccinia psidii MF-1]